MVNLKVKLPGLEMKNPVIPASGTFGFGYEFTMIKSLRISVEAVLMIMLKLQNVFQHMIW